MIIEELRRRTVSDLFIVPTLKISRTVLSRLGYINSFMFNSEEPEVDGHVVHLLFKPSKPEEFNDFMFKQRLIRKDIIDEKDYLGGLIIISFALPKELNKDYERLWRGEYSQLSAVYKALIPEYVEYKKDGQIFVDVSAQHLIITKSPAFRKKLEELFDVNIDDSQELWTKMTVNKETFKLSNYAESSAANAG